MNQLEHKFQLKQEPFSFMIKKSSILVIAASIIICTYFFLKQNSVPEQLSKISNTRAIPIPKSSTETNWQKQQTTANSPTPKKNNNNVLATLNKRSSIDTDVSDPTIVKRLLLKKGIYLGDYLGNEDVHVDAPRPKNFLTEVNKYFNMYSIPAWFNHIEVQGPGQYDFRGPDQVADFAVAHRAKIQAHNMVWYISLPDWLKNGYFTPDQLQVILKNHIQTVIRHYRDKYPGAINSWNIVNESMSDSENLDPRLSYPNGLRKNLPIWNVIHKPGSTDPTDYIQLAFEWAHEADPNVKLYWNEYNTEYKGFKMDRWFKIVKELKDKGTPIDGVGFQTHLSLAYSHPLDELRQNMDRFAAIGLECQVTEMDVLMSSTSIVHPPYHPTFMNSLAANLPTVSDYQHQADLYKGVIDACINAKKCKALILFGEWDPGSFANITWKGRNGRMMGPFYPNILDDNMKPKLAFKALVNEVNTLIPH